MRSASAKNGSAKQIDKFRRHARFVIEHHFGSRPSRTRYKAGGLSNFVFEVTHGKQDLIVRISPDKSRLNVFVKEQWCERIAREAGIPTARILETGFAVIPFPYVITERIAGREAVGHPEQRRMMRELGSLAAKINTIRTQGFGETFDWSNNELSRNDSFKEFVENEYRVDERLEILERSKLLPAPTMKLLKRVCREMRSIKGKPSLNHGDLRLKNVIVDDDGRIKAIIDWEKATSNIAPQWELSIALHDLDVEMKQQFVEGYGLKEKKFVEMAPFVKAFNLLNYTNEISRAKDKGAIDRLRLRFARVFDLYSL